MRRMYWIRNFNHVLGIADSNRTDSSEACVHCHSAKPAKRPSSYADRRGCCDVPTLECKNSTLFEGKRQQPSVAIARQNVQRHNARIRNCPEIELFGYQWRFGYPVSAKLQSSAQACLHFRCCQIIIRLSTEAWQRDILVENVIVEQEIPNTAWLRQFKEFLTDLTAKKFGLTGGCDDRPVYSLVSH